MRTSLSTMPPIKTACSTAYATHLIVSATPCQVLRVYASIKHDAPNAIYYLQVIDSSAPVNGGGAITLLSVREINHKQNETELYVMDFANYGVRCAAGCVVQLSTTIGVGTLDGINLLASAEYI